MTEMTDPKPPKTWDFLVTLLLIFVMVALSAALTISALGSSVTNQACSAAIANCDESRVRLGQLVCTYGPPAIALASIVVSIVRVLRRKVGFAICIIGMAAMTGAFFIGRLILDSGIPATAT
jgi:hypothetical protein